MERLVAKAFMVGSLAVAMAISACSTTEDVGVDSESTYSNSGYSNDGYSGGNTSSGESSAPRSGETISAPQQPQQPSESSTINYGGVDNSLYSVYFGFDRFVIEGARNVDTIKNNARLIKVSNSKVRVEGNTDEWGSDEYNYALALKRASSVKDALVNDGVSAGDIELVSYGESKPICTEKTRECWKENRRADFVVTPR